MINRNFGQLPEINRRMIANALKRKAKQVPVIAEQESVIEEKPAPKRRGRPPKKQVDE